MRASFSSLPQLFERPPDGLYDRDFVDTLIAVSGARDHYAHLWSNGLVGSIRVSDVGFGKYPEFKTACIQGVNVVPRKRLVAS